MEKYKELRAIEFFSGIGGYSFAVYPIKPIAAFDMNLVANKVYHLNHGTLPSTKAIDYLSIADIDSLKANCWLMSPPCQPFTLNGSRKDHLDKRTKPLLHLIDILPKLQTIPDYIMLENVPNFEVSETRTIVVRALRRLGFKFLEFLISPVEIGVPNNRRRSFLLARRVGELADDDSVPKADIITELPSHLRKSKLPELDTFLETDVDIDEYRVPLASMEKRFNFRFDVVTRNSKMSSTFTKGYGTDFLKSSGSLLLDGPLSYGQQGEQVDSLTIQTRELGPLSGNVLENLRFFTPLEISRLHGIPDIKWPDTVTKKQKYQLLGNGVTSSLIRILFFEILLQIE